MLPKLEELVLFAVFRNGSETTAADVQAALSEAMKKEQAFGSIFTTLERLNQKRLVKWKKGQPNGRRGGRAPRLYEITASGQHALREALRVTQTVGGIKGLGGLPEPVGALP